jgi:hypothetical protein
MQKTLDMDLYSARAWIQKRCGNENKVTPETIETTIVLLAWLQDLDEPIAAATCDGEIMIEWSFIGLSVQDEYCEIWSPEHMESQFTIPNDLDILVQKIREASSLTP